MELSSEKGGECTSSSHSQNLCIQDLQRLNTDQARASIKPRLQNHALPFILPKLVFLAAGGKENPC